MTEVIVRLKRPPLSRMAPGEANYFRFRLSPEVTRGGVGGRAAHPRGRDAGARVRAWHLGPERGRSARRGGRRLV